MSAERVETPVTEQSITDKLEAQFFGGEPEKKSEAEVPQSDEAAVEAALDAEDAPVPTVGDEVELEMDDGPRKFSKAELKALAKKGFEFDQVKTSSEQTAKQAQQALQHANAIMQLAPQVEALRERGRLALANIQQLDQRIGELKDDPIARYDVEIQRRQMIEYFHGLGQQESQLAGQMAHAQQLRARAEVEAEVPHLLKALPHWADASKRATDQKFIAEYMVEHGYPAEEINGLSKSRYVKTLLDAAKYNAIVKNRNLKRETAKLPPVVTPGTPQTSGQKAQAERLDYTRQMKSAKTETQKANLIRQRLERML